MVNTDNNNTSGRDSNLFICTRVWLQSVGFWVGVIPSHVENGNHRQWFRFLTIDYFLNNNYTQLSLLSHATAPLNSTDDGNEIRIPRMSLQAIYRTIPFLLVDIFVTSRRVRSAFRCLPIRPPVRPFLVSMSGMCATWP